MGGLNIRYSLRTSHYSPLTTHLSLLISHYSSLTTHLSLLTSHYSPLTTHLSLLTSHYSPLTTHLSLLTSHYSPHSRFRFRACRLIYVFDQFDSHIPDIQVPVCFYFLAHFYSPFTTYDIPHTIYDFYFAYSTQRTSRSSVTWISPG